MSVGRSQGGLPPDRVVEREDLILKDTQRLIETYHDGAHGAMLNVAVAPCSPFSVSRDPDARVGRRSRARTGCACTRTWRRTTTTSRTAGRSSTARPAEYAQDLGWLGHDVWHAHCVKLDAAGIGLFAGSRTGVAHCPCSNMRLASGIAPVRRMLDAGVPVGLGVDGSASNDGAQMVAEARQALLLARVGRSLEPFGCDHGPAEMTARDVLAIATRGGAQVLGRSHDIGQLAPGMCADIALFDLRGVGMAGGAGARSGREPAAVRDAAGGLDDRQRARDRARGPARHRRAGTPGRAAQPACCRVGERCALRHLRDRCEGGASAVGAAAGGMRRAAQMSRVACGDCPALLARRRGHAVLHPPSERSGRKGAVAPPRSPACGAGRSIPCAPPRSAGRPAARAEGHALRHLTHRSCLSAAPRRGA